MLASAWSLGAWYAAEYAKSGRSKCKEFRCKQCIASGELRIGVLTEENDHWGGQQGWYHPKCLWKSFEYKKNANKRIESLEEIKNLEHLKPPELELLKGLLEEGTSLDPEGVDCRPQSIKRKLEGDVMTLSGPTFHFREDLKRLGATYCPKSKTWSFVKKENDGFQALEDFLKASKRPRKA